MGSTTSDLPKVHEETRVNLNDRVKVVLTPRGLEVLRAKVRELDFANSNVSTNHLDANIKVHYLREGEYVFQMYEFMAIFGSELPTFATCDSKYCLFESNNLVLLPNDV